MDRPEKHGHNKLTMGEEQDVTNSEDESKDSKNLIFGFEREYLIPKGFYFFFFGAQGSLIPYLSLFLKQLELSASQVGIITGIKPYIAFFFIPIWGAVADRYQKSKIIFIMSMMAINVGLVAYAFAPIDLCEENHMVSKKVRIMERSSNLSTYLEQLSMMAEESLDETPWPQRDGTAYQDTGQVHHKKTVKVFLYLLFITIICTTISCPSLTLGDSATVQQLRENNETHKYGKQRLWGSIGSGSMAFLVGAAVSKTHLCPPGSAKRNDVNYYPCFVTYGLFMLIALLIGFKLKFDHKRPEPDTPEDDDVDEETKTNESVQQRARSFAEGLRLMMTPRHFMFLITVFVVGICMGLIQVFLFWHLKDLGGTQLLFSYMSAVKCIAEVSVYFLSSKLISRLGHIRVLYLGLVCYSIKLFAYAVVEKPWYVLPVESLAGITTAGVWASIMSYVGIHSMEGVNVTLQGNALDSRCHSTLYCFQSSLQKSLK